MCGSCSQSCQTALSAVQRPTYSNLKLLEDLEPSMCGSCSQSCQGSLQTALIAVQRPTYSNLKLLEDLEGERETNDKPKPFPALETKLHVRVPCCSTRGNYVEQSDDSQLHRWYAQYLESKADLDGASKDDFGFGLRKSPSRRTKTQGF